jgi:hypothetical protein
MQAALRFFSLGPLALDTQSGESLESVRYTRGFDGFVASSAILSGPGTHTEWWLACLLGTT